MPPILLQSKDHSHLLDVIDVLRSHGVSRYVPLPQIIVCGDQSSGKSSVLNAVSGVKFPTKENLCTRFAIELILRRSPESNVKVSIIAGLDRSERESAGLGRFQYAEASIEGLPDIIEKATAEMGVGPDGKAFSGDVLRIEVFGPEQSNLTLVDLPGVIHSENKQQSAEDVRLVSNLVKTYMASSRSIILAVVSARNDYANQIVTKMAREVDPKGQRTLGIITKPDALDVGSESEKSFIELAKNDIVSFRLGWHVLKNRDWVDRDCSAEERDKKEQEFFMHGAWTALPKNQLGVAALKPRLSTVLRDQIISEMPNLIRDVEAGIDECRARLAKLGISRASLAEQRLYLTRISQSFGSLIRAAIDGIYTDPFFGDARTKIGFSKRLRAVIQDHLIEFKEDMRDNGHAVEIVDDDQPYDDDSRTLTRTEFLKGVKNLLRRTRGRELPGLFNPMLVGDLFYEQSEPWSKIVDSHREKISDAVSTCVNLVLEHITDSTTRDGLQTHVFSPAKERHATSLQEKIKEIMKPHLESHPITYNHYFTDTISKARSERVKRQMKASLSKFFKLPAEMEIVDMSRQKFDVKHLIDALTQPSEPDMDLYACSEAADDMQAYYKVALKTLVDNFATLAVEFCLVETSVTLFTPEMVLNLSDEVLRQIATEPEESLEERKATTAKLDSLEEGLRTLRALKGIKLQEESEDGDDGEDSEDDRSSEDAQPVDREKSVSDDD